MRIRTIAVAWLLLCPPALALAQTATLKLPSLDHLQGRAIDSVDITIDSWPMRLVASLVGSEDPEMRDLLVKLRQVQVRSYEFEADDAYSKSDVDMVRRQLSGPGWSPLLRVRSTRERSTVDICISRDGDKINGIALLAAEPRKLTILNIAGSMDPADIDKLQGRLGVPDLGL